MDEIFSLIPKIVRCSHLTKEEIIISFYELLRNVELYNESFISESALKKAYELCKDIDDKDTLFVALTFEFDGLLWTGDKVLKNGLSKKGFSKFFKV